ELLYRRKPKRWTAADWDYRALVVGQWAQAIGATSAEQQEVLHRVLEANRSRLIQTPPAEHFANLDPSVLEFAGQKVTQLYGEDSRLTYYFWRCLSRLAAYEKNGHA